MSSGMVQPSWLADVLAVVVLAVALFSAARLVVSRRSGLDRQGELDADGIHVLMGVAMAGMLVSGLATFSAGVWEVVFTIGAGWFALRSAQIRRPGLAGSGGQSSWVQRLGPVQCCEYPVPHLIDCVAMAYMFWAVRTTGSAGAGSGGMAGMGAGVGGVRLPALGLILVVCIAGYVVWLGDRVQRFAPASAVVLASAVPSGGMPPGDGSALSVSGSASVSGPAGRRLLAPRAATVTKIAMGVAMGVMLVDLL
jgi:hypothetical protein